MERKRNLVRGGGGHGAKDGEKGPRCTHSGVERYDRESGSSSSVVPHIFNEWKQPPPPLPRVLLAERNEARRKEGRKEGVGGGKKESGTRIRSDCIVSIQAVYMRAVVTGSRGLA